MACVDTDFLVGILRSDPDVGKKMQELKSKRESLHATIINEVELYKGAFRAKDADKEVARVKRLIDELLVITLDHESARLAGEIDSRIRSAPIGASDLLIAAIALAHNQTLLTRNVKHFAKVPGLTIERW